MRPALLLALLPLVFAPPALADSLTIPPVITFDGTQPIEADIAGRLGGTVADGKLVVHPADQHGGRKVDYSLTGPGVPTASVDVSGVFDTDLSDPSLVSGAGLVMKDGGDGNAEGYFLFVVTRDSYVIKSFANGGFGQSTTGSLPDGVVAGKPVRLAAREQGEGVEFFINGQSVGSLSDGGVTGSGMGLIHLGRGTFTFDNFAMNLKGEIAPGGPTDVSVTEPTPPPANPQPVHPPVANPPPAVTPQADVPEKPPLPPPLPTASFYVGENGQPVGPLPLDVLITWIKSGRVSATTLVWKEGMPNWAAAKTVPELAAAFP